MSIYDLLTTGSNGNNGLMYSAMTRLHRDDTRGVTPGSGSDRASTYPLLDQAARVRQLLDFIAKPESGGNYNAVYGNAGAKRDLSQMTLGQVIADAHSRIKSFGSSATGRYQMLADTMSDMASKSGIPMDTPFTPQLQDYMATKLLERRGLKDYMDGSLPAANFAGNLAHEWATLPAGPGGQSAYEGDKMGNHAGVGYSPLMGTLLALRGDSQGMPDMQQAGYSGPGGGGGGGPGGGGGMPASLQALIMQDANIPLTAGQGGAQGPEPNFWDKLQAVRSQGGGGISALLTAGLGTGAGWAPGMQNGVGTDPYKLAQLRSARLSGDKTLASILGGGSQKPLNPLQEAQMKQAQARTAYIQQQQDMLGKPSPGERANMQKQELAGQQAKAGYDIGVQLLDKTWEQVKDAHSKVGGRSLGAWWNRNTAYLPNPIGSDEKAQADFTLRSTATNGLLKAGAGLKGSQSEREWTMLANAVPEENAPLPVWRQWFDTARAKLKELYAKEAAGTSVADTPPGAEGFYGADTGGGLPQDSTDQYYQ